MYFSRQSHCGVLPSVGKSSVSLFLYYALREHAVVNGVVPTRVSPLPSPTVWAMSSFAESLCRSHSVALEMRSA